MASYKISTDTLIRFGQIIKFFESSVTEELKREINAIRLEIKSGNVFAIATNQKVAAIERIGSSTESDAAVHVIMTEELQKICRNGGSITFNVMPELLIAVAQNEAGETCTNFTNWSIEGVLQNWRSWAAPDASESKGVMHWHLHQVHTLFECSPSGRVYFPTHIDAEKPVTLRDCFSDKWVGLFFPQPEPGEPYLKSAKLPEWWSV